MDNDNIVHQQWHSVARKGLKFPVSKAPLNFAGKAPAHAAAERPLYTAGKQLSASAGKGPIYGVGKDLHSSGGKTPYPNAVAAKGLHPFGAQPPRGSDSNLYASNSTRGIFDVHSQPEQMRYQRLNNQDDYGQQVSGQTPTPARLLPRPSANVPELPGPQQQAQVVRLQTEAGLTGEASVSVQHPLAATRSRAVLLRDSERRKKPRQRRQKRDAAEWELHKQFMANFYLKENNTLTQLREHMRKNFGFDAS